MKLPILPFAFIASSLVFILGAMTASAQTRQQASIDFALTANPDDYRKDSDLSSRARGLSFGASKGRLRFEFGWPAWHKVHRDSEFDFTVDEQAAAYRSSCCACAITEWPHGLACRGSWEAASRLA